MWLLPKTDVTLCCIFSCKYLSHPFLFSKSGARLFFSLLTALVTQKLSVFRVSCEKSYPPNQKKKMAQKLHELYRKLDEQLEDADWNAAVESCDKSSLSWTSLIFYNLFNLATMSYI
jgi:arginine decarboxylase-like protein